MPELPEVETTRLGLLPLVKGHRIVETIIRDRRLRWPIPRDLAKTLAGRRVRDVTRRGKYLLWDCGTGYLLSHLGMSGSLHSVGIGVTPGKHDHVDFRFDNGTIVRYTDPRRFGALLWIEGQTVKHPLLEKLGPEPLDDAFDAAYLVDKARGRLVTIKEFIMNGQVVVGVGNIYASESLFLAGIRPTHAAGKISRPRLVKLVACIKQTLAKAIRAGGSSLRDYVQTNGELGYFQVDAFVYDREGLPCRICGSKIRSIRQGQRSTFFCAKCQK